MKREIEQKVEKVIVYPGIDSINAMTSVELMELLGRVKIYQQYLERKVRALNQR